MDRVKLLSLSLGLIVLLAAPLEGQVNTGTILGVITDPSGAAVPNAKVTATNEDTAFSRSVQSLADGTYLIPLLPIGPRYMVTAEAPSFKTLVRSGIQLELKQNIRLDMQLQLGQVAEKVEVTGQAALVDTHSVTSGEVVGEQRLRELPLNGRNPLQLAGLVAGVTYLAVTPTLAGNRSASVMSVNGSRLNETDYQLNGVRFAGSYLNTGLNYPNPDALEEFKLITNPNSAEYGQYAGAVFSAVTKSGTNDFHGSVFEFLRNDALNARNFFASTVPTLKQNQFGGTAGGRLVKDRLFWFGSYQGFRIRRDALSASSPLTAGERNGLITSASPVLDPETGDPFPQNVAGQYVIPVDRIDPVSETLLERFVPIGTPGQVYQAIGSTKTDVSQYAGKVDYRISDSDQVSGSVLWDTTSSVNPFYMGSFPSYGSIEQPQAVRVVSGSYLHSFKPNIINEFRFGWSKQEENFKQFGVVSPEDLGMQDWNYLGIDDEQIQSPRFFVSGRFTLGSFIGGKWREGGQNFQFTDSLTMVKGKHNIRTGVDLYHREHVLDANIANTGFFDLTGTWTGNSTADFLLGKIGGELKVRYVNHPGYRAWSRGFFFQDDWKIHPRFTLNLGLRYELHDPFREFRAEGESGGWQTHAFLPLPGEGTFRAGVQSTVLPEAPTGLLYYGDKTSDFPNGIPRGMIARDKMQFQPRIGLAWDPFGDGKTSVRASAGFFTNAQYPDMNAQNSQNLPWVVIQYIVNPQGSLSDPYAGQTPYPSVTDPENILTDPLFFTPYLPSSEYGWSTNYVLPRVTTLGFSVQRQIYSNLMFDVGYLGKLGRHLHSSRDINSAAYIPGDCNGVPCSTYANLQDRRPYLPGAFQGIFMQESIATSSYNSLQATLRYRARGGLTFLSSYTWSHSIDTCSQYAAGGNCYNDPANTKTNRGPSTQDQRHVYSLSLVYDIPDPGKRIDSRALSAILGGWELTGIVTARSGLPFTVIMGYDSSITGTGQDRPDLVGNPAFSGDRSQADKVNAWFNTSAFVASQPGTHGTNGRNTLFSPGVFNSDLGLLRNFKIREKGTLQFRAEFFNAFNQTHLGAPSAALISASFGKISSAGDPRLIQFGLKFSW